MAELTKEERLQKIEDFLNLALDSIKMPSRIPDNIYALEAFANTTHNILETLYYLDILKGGKKNAPTKKSE